MKLSYLLLALPILALTAPTLNAEAADSISIALPAPRLDGDMSVEKALKGRRSLRDPAPTALSLTEAGQLCWAAQGVTDDKGHRTAPSAMARYPLELYVIVGAIDGIAPGFYHYDPGAHALRLVAPGDMRADVVTKAIGQEWITRAPAVYVITGVIERMGSMSDRGRQFMDVEAGLAAQGFFLQATAMGLGSTYVGGFGSEAIHAALRLPKGEEVLAVLPVGHKPRPE